VADTCNRDRRPARTSHATDERCRIFDDFDLAEVSSGTGLPWADTSENLPHSEEKA